VVAVEPTDGPLPVGDTLPLELSPEVKEGPAGVLRQAGLGAVLEAVEVIHLQGPGQVDQAGVDVLG
jgi:hypothetical protein